MNDLQFSSTIPAAGPDGVAERDFTVGEIPGVLWEPSDPSDPSGPRRVVLIGHGGGLHIRTPGVVNRARRLAARHGLSVVAIDAPGHGERPRSEEDVLARAELRRAIDNGEPIDDISCRYGLAVADRAVPEWRLTLDALERTPGFEDGLQVAWGGGITLGTAVGIRLIEVEPRIRAAILGNGFVVHDSLVTAARGISIPLLYLMQWDDEHTDRAAALSLFDAFASVEKSLHANPGEHGRVPEHEQDNSAAFLVRHLAG